MGTAPSNIFNELHGSCFFPVFGTMEFTPGSIREISNGTDPTIVGKGTPKTWDYNNGTIVVYDEDGFPWIRSVMFVSIEFMQRFAAENQIQKGAFVPHSNDGRTFKRIVEEQTGEQI